MNLNSLLFMGKTTETRIIFNNIFAEVNEIVDDIVGPEPFSDVRDDACDAWADELNERLSADLSMVADRVVYDFRLWSDEPSDVCTHQSSVVGDEVYDLINAAGKV